MNPKEVLRATDPEWKREARKFIERAQEVVVIDLTPQAFRDAIALCQEFDYKPYILDKGEDLKEYLHLYEYTDQPVAPKQIWLAHRDAAKPKISN